MPAFNRETTLNLEAGDRPEIHVSNVRGNVRVRGDDRNDVQVTARARFDAASDAEADEMLADLTRHIRAEYGRVEIKSPRGERHRSFRFGRGGGGRWAWAAALQFGESATSIDYEVLAPRGHSVDLKLVHGDAVVQAAGGGLRAHLVNGACTLEDVHGVSAHLVNGVATLLRASGNVDLKLTNGRLLLQDVRGNTTFHLVNGNAEILDPSGSVNGSCVSGRLEFTGAVRSDVSLHTAHGGIVLTVPADSRFRLDAWSGLGSVTSELEVRDAGPGAGPAPSVSLRTETGSIELRRLREPATVTG
jgi:hypothetical protein